jgi:hypothetical protein
VCILYILYTFHFFSNIRILSYLISTIICMSYLPILSIYKVLKTKIHKGSLLNYLFYEWKFHLTFFDKLYRTIHIISFIHKHTPFFTLFSLLKIRQSYLTSRRIEKYFSIFIYLLQRNSVSTYIWTNLFLLFLCLFGRPPLSSTLIVFYINVQLSQLIICAVANTKDTSASYIINNKVQNSCFYHRQYEVKIQKRKLINLIFLYFSISSLQNFLSGSTRKRPVVISTDKENIPVIM